MVRDIRQRLAALEARHLGAPKIEVWINEGDGLLRSPTGQVMTRKTFDAAFPDARKLKLDIFEKAMRAGPEG